MNVGLIAAFHRLGFATYRHLPGLNVLVPLPADAEPDAFLLNVFACRPGTAAGLAAVGLLLPAPAALPPPADNAYAMIAKWTQSRPWARLLWPAGRPAHPLAEALPYLLALVDLLHSEETGNAPAQRWAFALRGLAALRAVPLNQASPPRLYSTARVALALGERTLGIACLRQATEQASPADMAREPFLPPEPRFDDLDPAGNLPAALAAMRDEPLLTHSAFSVYFARKSTLPVLLRLARNPLRSPVATRRLLAAQHLLPIGPI